MTHQYGDERIVEWLKTPREWPKYEKDVAYNPRSDKHGAASCQYLLDDLLHESENLRDAAERGDIIVKEDHTVGAGVMRWNVDLVLGPPEGEPQSRLGDRPISVGEPEEVWLAIDAKSVMTEHGKARRNRQRDINSFADVMHHHFERAVTGGVILINIADRFDSPTRDEDDITTHRNVERLVEETVDMFRGIERADGEISSNIDAAACIVVRHTNMEAGVPTELVTDPPAPQPGDIVHYRTFLNILLETFEDRFFS